MTKRISRRTLIRYAGLAPVSLLAACEDIRFPGAPSQQKSDLPPPPNGTPAALPSSTTGYTYAVQRSDEDWRTRLTPAEYDILRQGGTEPRNSHPYSRSTGEGLYHCKGCGLPIYASTEKVILDIGWVFFRHSLRDSVLLGIDEGRIEAHCRRCGGHLGHILYVESEVLHCINGTALDFKSV